MNSMIHIPAPAGRRLVWYLAMEEYFGERITDYPQGVFFTWVVEPTVIFGRHQIMSQEVNLDYCRANGVNTFRRKSGGGCVYADEGNLMLSYIVPSQHPEQVFQQYLDDVATLLQQLGFSAVKSTNNDILINDFKVSGNACYALKTGTIVHGTMLYDVDMNRLVQAITPGEQKLKKHGVESVRQRVKNLREQMQDMPIAPIQNIHELSAHFVQGLTNQTIALTEEDIRAIDAIEQTYLAPDFIAGK